MSRKHKNLSWFDGRGLIEANELQIDKKHFLWRNKIEVDAFEYVIRFYFSEKIYSDIALSRFISLCLVADRMFDFIREDVKDVLPFGINNWEKPMANINGIGGKISYILRHADIFVYEDAQNNKHVSSGLDGLMSMSIKRDDLHGSIVWQKSDGFKTLYYKPITDDDYRAKVLEIVDCLMKKGYRISDECGSVEELRKRHKEAA